MGFELITKLRKEKKLSLKKLADESGVPLGTLKKIVYGVTKDPQLETLKALAKTLGCTVDDFDGEELESNYEVGPLDKHLELLSKWDRLTEENQRKILGMIELKLSEQ